MNKRQILPEFLDFLGNSPTQYHAVNNISAILKQNDYQKLDEQKKWKLPAKGKFFLSRDNSSLIAFNIGQNKDQSTGFQITGVHTDSPGIKIKPKPDNTKHNYLSLRTETYGGLNAATWFDRDLSIAGRVSCLKNDQLKDIIIDFKQPLAIIPNIAVHLKQNSDRGGKTDIQKELVPIISGLKKGEKSSFLKILADHLKIKELKNIIDFDLFFYDMQSPGLLGHKKEFITGSRIDNLTSCFSALQALIVSKNSKNQMLVCYNHEEIGSNTDVGAAGSFLEAVLKRICLDNESYYQTIANSRFISVDCAHAINPNYPEAYDSNHSPVMNQGPVIKINANQKYISSSEGSAFFQILCRKAKVPYQIFSNNSNIKGGSTIGPITAARIGVRSIDIGIATLAMHSIREVCGTDDIYYLYKALLEFYNQ